MKHFYGVKHERVITISPPTFIWCVALLNVLVFHQPLMHYVGSHLDIGTGLGVGVLVVLTSLSCVLMWLLLGGLSLISNYWLKPTVTLLLVGNAVALYAMNTYQVILDKSMMGNVLNTDRQESLALFHPKLLVYLAGAVLLSILLFRFLRWAPQSRIWRLGHLFFAVCLASLLVFLNSGAWLWVDKHATVVGGLLLPWSYSMNTARYVQEQRLASRQFPTLPDLTWNSHASLDVPPVTVVLVIGESARTRNFSLYGYERLTNPLLAKRQLALLPAAQACATYTVRALECMLSHDPQASGLTHEILPNYLSRSGQVEVSWRSRNWGEPPLQSMRVIRGSDLSDLCAATQCANAQQDEALLAGLESEIEKAAHERQLIVLHQSGSHGPAYNTKYPSQFSRFEPACDSVDLKQCNRQSLVNAYDNSILYTDYFLDQLIGLLARQQQRRTVMIFISDHGESLGEGGLYLHGMPEIIAPKEQKEIPFLVWMSPSFAKHVRINPQQLQPVDGTAQRGTHQNGHAQIFHSVLGALGGRSSAYRADLDIFQTLK